MKKIILNNKGEMIPSDLKYFGGKYTFMERFRMDGIGSPKVIYENGIPYFNELSTFAENEISFVNFELMKNGFIIHLNRNQRLRSIGFQSHEILKIRLFGLLEKNGEVKSELEISTINKTFLKFKVTIQNFKSVQIFLKKKALRDKLEMVYKED